MGLARLQLSAFSQKVTILALVSFWRISLLHAVGHEEMSVVPRLTAPAC